MTATTKLRTAAIPQVDASIIPSQSLRNAAAILDATTAMYAQRMHALMASARGASMRKHAMMAMPAPQKINALRELAAERTLPAMTALIQPQIAAIQLRVASILLSMQELRQ